MESAHGRWTSFTGDVALKIETAYRNSEPVIRFFSGRHRYIIHFASMVQVSCKWVEKKSFHIIFFKCKITFLWLERGIAF